MKREKGSRSAIETDFFVGSMIRAYREMRSLTLQELAAELQMSHQQLNKYEHGTNRVSAGILWNICLILNVPIQSFFPTKEEVDMPVFQMKDLLRQIHEISGQVLAEGE